MSYKQNAASNRDALFGNSGKTDKQKKTKGKSTASATSSKTSMGYQYRPKERKTTVKPGLVGAEKEAKLKEARAHQEKAKKCLQKGLFSKADPLSASTYYKRAADDFQKCGEFRLERFNRMDSAECQLQVGAFATAALEYTRAAELVVNDSDETAEAKHQISRDLHLKSAEAWRNANEGGKAAASKVKAALAMIDGDESRALSSDVLMAIEEAIEAHVPDPLNPYARYRQTGVSLFVNAGSGETAENPSAESLELARQQIITDAYAHESVQEVVYLLVSYNEFASALYSAGAVTTLLSQGGVATLSLSRAFLAETILSLAMGDAIAAEENFLQRHVQKTSYLSSRECKFAEELFRAGKHRSFCFFVFIVLLMAVGFRFQ
jgi:tetratricopeptide (TPR) repeat protein